MPIIINFGNFKALQLSKPILCFMPSSLHLLCPPT